MKSLLIKPTADTPGISFSLSTLTTGRVLFEITGKSAMEEVRKFYEPVFIWLEQCKAYLRDMDNNRTLFPFVIQLDLRLEYFNSTSAKIVLEIIYNLSKINLINSNIKIEINWYYCDEDIRQSGEEFKEISPLPVSVVPVSLFIESAQNTPQVTIDIIKKIFEISGNSFPENALDFYAPVINWINNYGKKYLDANYQFNFKLSYFNTSTAKAIFEILEMLSDLNASGLNLSVNWFYSDEDQKDEGEEIASETKMPFKFIKNIKSR